jgi:hypothetical protein
MFILWRSCRANRAAIDPSRRHTDKQTAIESPIASLNGAVTGLWVKPFHVFHYALLGH